MSNIEEKLKALSEAIIIYDKEQTLEIVKELIDAKLPPKKIIHEGLLVGIEVVKERFDRLEYFLPELIFASEAIKVGIDLIIENLPQDEKEDLICGKVVIGTPKGDIHDVGKNIFATLLMASGFTVYDIGIDKPIDSFIEKAKEVDADIIAISCLMTTSLIQQKELIEDLIRLGLRDQYKIMLGGGAVQDSWAQQIGADGYSISAASGVSLAKDLVKRPS
ncbi:cobalamin-dependent protein [Clostridiaceae bacterium 35-E11]